MEFVIDDPPAAASSDEQPLGAASDPSRTGGYELIVKKKAETKFDRYWEWKIEKKSYTTELYVEYGYTKPVEYEVTVTPYYKDANWKVSGEISVYNPTYSTAKIEKVVDVIKYDYGAEVYASVDCGVYFPHYLKPVKYLTCKYWADLESGKDAKNYATVKTSGYVAGGTGTADVKFDYPTKNLDKCVTVKDETAETELGYVCEKEETFKYWMDLGAYEMCGPQEFKNVASFVTNDTYTYGSDYHTVYLKVSCNGCTRTQGYWKTHSYYGPAPYDETWKKVGENTYFYKSGKTWYELFKMPPKGGDVYIKLAHQYMAARLSILTGADPYPIKDVLKVAEDFFKYYKLYDPLPAKVKTDALYWAETLDKYNNGLLGVQHCYD